MVLKQCSKCKNDLPLDSFSIRKDSKDGYKGQCKTCVNLTKTIYRAKNLISIQEREAKWRKENPEKMNQYRKKWTINNSDVPKKWVERNIDKVRETKRRYKRNKRNTSPSWKIAANLSKRIWDALRVQKTNKNNTSIELIGCNPTELKNHIESQFVSGMNWNNYGIGEGKWNIDHIKPCASFDLTDLKQQRICFNYLNLRPLWSLDNISKNSVYNNKRYKHK